MAQPTEYNRQASFSNLQAQAPSDPPPGNTLDAEFNAVKVTLDEILANLELIQRDDGYLANESVGLDQLSPEIEVGWQAPEVWVTATDYVVGNTVFHGSGFYRVLEDHTAGTFATDLAAGNLELIVDLSTLTIGAASAVAVTPTGNIASTDVQAALAELDSEKAATSHTHPASAISDSTAAGRNMLTAANVTAQQALLGLGSLAYLNSIPVTDITANLALTGIISPSALGTSVNDWAPTGIATASTIRLSASTTGVTITGITAPAADGDIKILENTGSYAITLSPQSASSAAANRFAIAKPMIVGPNASIVLKYHLADAHWRLLDRSSHLPRGYIDGLTISNNSGDATNDIDVAIGECRGERGILDLVLTTAITGKQLDANWAAGSSAGMRYSGAAITNTTYYIFLIGKIDGTVDIFAYAGGTDPTSVLPAGYVDYRRIGAILRESAAVVPFVQRGDYFLRKTLTTIIDATNPGTSAVNRTLDVPTGIKVRAEIMVNVTNTSIGGQVYSLFTDLDATADTPSATKSHTGIVLSAAGGTNNAVATLIVTTDTSGRIRSQLSYSDAAVVLKIAARGWYDSRGKDS